jgi:hypothetical protein
MPEAEIAVIAADALVTQPDAVPGSIRTKLSPIIGRYMS